jgi:hypothetical protein
MIGLGVLQRPQFGVSFFWRGITKFKGNLLIVDHECRTIVFENRRDILPGRLVRAIAEE